MGCRVRYVRILPTLILLTFVGLCAPWPPAAARPERPPQRKATPPEAESLKKALAHWQHGYILHLLGHFEEAAAQFRASIQAHPTAKGHTFLGWSLSHLGQIREAIDECKKAIRIDPDYGNPYNDIGVYLIALGRPEEAIPWLQKAIRASDYCCYQFAHFNLGRVLLGQGKVAEARREFERALQHDPNYLPARQALEKIQAQERKTL